MFKTCFQNNNELNKKSIKCNTTKITDWFKKKFTSKHSFMIKISIN